MITQRHFQCRSPKTKSPKITGSALVYYYLEHFLLHSLLHSAPPTGPHIPTPMQAPKAAPARPKRPRAKQVQSRRWVFTLNNYTDADVDALVADKEGRFTYIVFGKEVGEQGVPHLQGYFELAKRRGPRGLADSLPGLARARLAVAQGTAEQNKAYCHKSDEDGFEAGKPMAQGKRSDLLAVKAAIDDGASNSDLWDIQFAAMVRYHKAFATYKKLRRAYRTWRTRVILIVGNSGTQKSFLAHLLGRSGYFGDGFYKVPHAKGSGLYFDGYDGQGVVLIDEMDGNRCTPTFLNELCDEYEFSVPVHGCGNVQFLAKTVIICSNYVPKDWWAGGHNIAPFMRRISMAVFRPGGLRAMARHRSRMPTILRGSAPAYARMMK